jgi:AAA+ superfamily predicted ATPase
VATQSLEGRLSHLLATKTPILLVISENEDRVEDAIRGGLRALAAGSETWSWTVTEGLRMGRNVVQGTVAVADALNAATGLNQPAIFFFKDLHAILQAAPDPWLIRRLKDVASVFAAQGKTLVFRSSTLVIPDDLVPTVTVVEDGPPTQAELLTLLQEWEGAAEGSYTPPAPDLGERFLRAAAGLPLYEVRRVCNRVERESPAPEDRLLAELLDEKARLVTRSGLLEFVENDVAIDQVGGLENFKAWLERRRHAFTEAARQAGVKPPRGVLLMGITGCGKSIAVKAIASFWNLPLLRLDMIRLYGGALGAPEEAIRRVTRQAESLAPCILWMDEIETGISVAGHKADAGPASRILGYFLTWMQERGAPVFVGATANAIDLLPAEALRKGRFDEIFYVSLPNKTERREILRSHLLRRRINPDAVDLEFIAHGSKGFSGSEIEQIVAAALEAAQAEGRTVTGADLAASTSRTVPMSVTMAEQIKRIEAWAFHRAVRASAKGED